MSRHVLGVDVDSTVWDATAAFDVAARELFGISWPMDTWITGDALKERFGPDRYQIFDAVLSPDAVEGRELYPGVADAIGELYEMGVDTYFITHNYRPEAMKPALGAWLTRELSVPFRLKALKEDKMPVLNDAGAFGMIDDRPDFITRVADSGLWAATLNHPWCHDLPSEIHRFDHWDEVPELVRAALSDMRAIA